MGWIWEFTDCPFVLNVNSECSLLGCFGGFGLWPWYPAMFGCLFDMYFLVLFCSSLF